MTEPTLLEIVEQAETANYPLAIDNPGFVRIKVDSQAQAMQPFIARVSDLKLTKIVF